MDNMLNESEPEVVYEQSGGVLATQISLEETRNSFSHKELDALAACGMSPNLAEKLFVEFQSIPVISEEDMFTENQDKQKIEHLLTREIEVEGKKIKVLQVDFYPPTIEFGGSTIGGVFTNTAEMILGMEGRGVLEVVPVMMENGQIFPDNANVRDITIEKGTFVILPPNVQGNRWKYLEPVSGGTEPSLRALFVAYPEAYENATIRKFDIRS